MARLPVLAALVLALAALLGSPTTARAADGPCRATTFEGAAYTVCIVDLRHARLRLFWQDREGRPYQSLSHLGEVQGSRLAFAMNAGMYHEDLSPVGLYVEEGRQLKAASTTDGPGNFHLKPNGVFFVRAGKAGVMETGRFLSARIKADIATQSGPMLVIGGAIHPKISADGPSHKVRNGVGVRDGGRTAVFAISEGPVSFGAFARLFRDELHCPDALFLDGSVSSLYAPALKRADVSRPLGPMIGALAR
jgi:uncharacterized protein YigE (DUF2233 family)